ncbi:hypothetical protein [Sunxiuqinia indica]|uniref:hypothetical protein n=1 Tax=Sunxiuqinia indica TaxID=2692584 RepID=UPI00135B4844|nr:hypothetical protein [Sunxiuqinia indica]
MNYLRHLNGFFDRLDEDQRLSSYHISLYLALFRQWNACRFGDRFVISRAEMMQQARIGSANTYARCMKELTSWGYIHYKPSSNLHKGSTVSCISFDPTSNTEFDSGIKKDTATDTGEDTTAAAGTATNTENDIKGNATKRTGNKTNTGTDTAGDITRNTRTNGDTKSDTPASISSDTGTASGRQSDIGADTGNHEDNPTGIQSDTGADTTSDTLLINNTKNIKQEEKKENPKEKERGQKDKNLKISREEKTSIPEFSDVKSFFRKNGFPESEAQQFYARYLSLGWKTTDNQPIVSWQALARKWMINNNKNNSHERPFNQIGAGRFSVPTDKDYSEPL